MKFLYAAAIVLATAVSAMPQPGNKGYYSDNYYAKKAKNPVANDDNNEEPPALRMMQYSAANGDPMNLEEIQELEDKKRAECQKKLDKINAEKRTKYGFSAIESFNEAVEMGYLVNDGCYGL